MKAPLPPKEAERLQALFAYEILDTIPETDFDDITLLAAQICGTSSAAVMLIDEQRQWAKSKIGVPFDETPRDYAFCSHTILQSEVFLVENALADARFADNPLVTGAPRIRFYAGAPLLTSEGHALGSLCVVGDKARTLSAQQQSALLALSRQVVAQLELRRKVRELRRAEDSIQALDSHASHTQAELRASQLQHQALFENMMEACVSCRLLYENGRAVDYLYVASNRAFEAQTGLKNAMGKKVSEVVPGIHQTNPEQLQCYERVARTGVAERYETYVPALDTWFSISVYSHAKETFVAIFDNVTERKRVENSLRESRQRLQLATESANIGIWEWDAQRDALHWDARMFSLYGLRPEAFGGRLADWEALLHPGDRPRCGAEFAALQSGRDELHTEFRIILPSGEVRHLEAHALLQRAADGSPLRMNGVNRDITFRKHAEIALRESDEKFRQIVDHITDGFWIRSPDLRAVHYLSPAFEKIWGRPLAELYGDFQVWADSIFPEDHTLVDGAFQSLLREAPSIELEHRILWPSGEVRWVRVKGFQVRDAAGRLIRLTGIVTDITERRRADQQLAYERNLLRTLLDQSPEHIYFKDLDSRLIRGSTALAQQFGLASAEELIGKTDFDFFAAEHAHTTFTEEQEIIRTGEAMTGCVEREVWLDGRPQSWVLTSKMPLRDEQGAIIGTFGLSKDITALKQAEEKLISERERLRAVFESIPVGVALCRHFPDGHEERIINEAHLRICGLTREQDQVPGIYGQITDPEDKHRHAALYRQFESGEIDRLSFEKRYLRLDGSEAWVVFFLQRHRYPDGIYDHLSGVIDITERKRLELHLQQSQKIETVGKMAGGIAHEFNSILTSVIGQSELLLRELPAGSQARRVATIIEGAERAATLTRQLLAFGRKQLLRPETLDLNHVLAEMQGVLQHLLGRDVETRLIPSPSLQPVKADADQIEQVILNLAMNAREAMAHGGRLTLETANVTFDAQATDPYPDLQPGRYAMLTLTDTGPGMPPEVKARVFEPFFTTKAIGQGTGLGLATSYGIIRQSGGHISLTSEPGQGTTVKIYLPQVEAPPRLPVARPPAPGFPRGHESILLVEEDPALREMATTLLQQLGYHIHSAATPHSALSTLSQLQEHPAHCLHVLITDWPHASLGEPELTQHLQSQHPSLRVLYTVPHSQAVSLEPIETHDLATFLRKPYSPAQLAQTLRKILDRPTPLAHASR